MFHDNSRVIWIKKLVLHVLSCHLLRENIYRPNSNHGAGFKVISTGAFIQYTLWRADRSRNHINSGRLGKGKS